MNVQLSYPGVYVKEDASPGLIVQGQPTAVPLFIGFFLARDAALAGQCLAVDSFKDFSDKFHTAAILVRTAIKKVEGSGTVADDEPDPDPEPEPEFEIKSVNCALGNYSIRHYFENGGGRCYILPLDENKIDTLSATIAAVPEVTLLVYCECRSSENDQAIYTALNPLLEERPGCFLIADSLDGNALTGLEAAQVAAYYPAFQTRYRYEWPASVGGDEILVIGHEAGLMTRTTLKLLAQNNDEAAVKIEALLDAELNNYAFSGARAVYLRSSPAMAGIYSRVDRRRGVWKAPANEEVIGVEQLVSLEDTPDNAPPVTLTEAKREALHKAGVNAIPYFASTGITVMGARTLAGKESNSDPNWIYIPVRRLFSSVERDLQAAIRRLMFEPNNQMTWSKVRVAIDNYLRNLWLQGALQGTKEAEAYFVEVGLGVTMTEQDLAAGLLIVDVGLAVVRPVEFVVLRFTQDLK